MKPKPFTFVQGMVLALLVLLTLGGVGWMLHLLLTPPPPVDVPSTVLPSPLPTASLPPALPTVESSPAPTPTPWQASCLPPSAESFPVQVARVLDGIRLEVEINGETRQVRYLGVELPQQSALAEALNRQWTENQTVQLIADPAVPPQGEEALYYVLAGEVFVNQALIREGAALPALYPPGIACMEAFLQAEAQARAEQKGVWKELLAHLPTPVVPVGLTPSACDCNRRYTCADFTTRQEAQACFDTCGDYRNTTLDPDHNGLACEDLP